MAIFSVHVDKLVRNNESQLAIQMMSTIVGYISVKEGTAHGWADNTMLHLKDLVNRVFRIISLSIFTDEYKWGKTSLAQVSDSISKFAATLYKTRGAIGQCPIYIAAFSHILETSIIFQRFRYLVQNLIS